MNPIAKLDQAHVWHPFTQMRDWARREPIVIVRGRGAMLEDIHGNRYLDANSSIWTNLHGHNHPALNASLRRQLDKIAHCSSLGLANEPASRLAEQLVNAANPTSSPRSALRAPRLNRVFFSDDGSTAMETALKLCYEYTRRLGLCRKPRFLSLQGGYHGDTVGAVALGHIDLLHNTWKGLLFKSDSVMAPYCYRCPFNRAKPERADAREYRKCNWECVGKVEQACRLQRKRGEPHAGFVFEPIIQGAAGMIAHPKGWLRRVAGVVREHGTLLIADEVMTAFGRVAHAPATPKRLAEGWSRVPPAGASPPGKSRGLRRQEACATFLACHEEGVQPDLVSLAKGLTGGYLPMAATLASEAIFNSFLGEYEQFKTFFHGHSYTANPLGAAVSLANLQLLNRPGTQAKRASLQQQLGRALQPLWSLPNVGDIRQAGLVAGIEMVRDWRTRKPFDLRERAGIRVCEAMARRGVLTRPIGNVVVLMPPYCTTPRQLDRMVQTLMESVEEVLG